LIVDAILAVGGSATTDEINEHVAKQWGGMRRRDGTPYTNDSRRAVAASLGHNSPIFKVSYAT